jgi:hypothetical protein
MKPIKVVVKHNIRRTKHSVHEASKAAVMRKALAAVDMDTEPSAWDIEWDFPTHGEHTVTLGG